MHIAICIATYRRPRLLQALLQSLETLTFQRVSKPTIRVIVAHNDLSGPAREVCENAPSRWPLTYLIEPQRGIARVRNRCVDEAHDTDFLAFIDDDEVAEADWLDCLLESQMKFDSDVVTGPVVPSFTVDVLQWIRSGDFLIVPDTKRGVS